MESHLSRNVAFSKQKMIIENRPHNSHGHGVGHTAERLRYIQKTIQGTKARPDGTNALAKGAGYHQKNHERSR